MCQKNPHKITLEKRAKNILPPIKIQQILACQTLTNKTLGFSLQTIFPFKLSLFFFVNKDVQGIFLVCSGM